ncbi:hypothetical protein Bca101_005731 [Brassica carinata]
MSWNLPSMLSSASRGKYLLLNSSRKSSQVSSGWSRAPSSTQSHQTKVTSLQENSDIQTDIPTENEILGIYRGISEETQNWVSSEYTDGIPRKLQSVGIFRGNSEENCVPRKKPMNSEEIL